MKTLASRTAVVLALAFVLTGSSAYGDTPENALKMEHKLTSKGVGARVRITRDDQSEITGSIRSVGPEGVVIVSNAAPDPTLVPYSTIAAVHPAHSEKGTKIGFGLGLFFIGIAVGTVVAVIVLIVTAHPSL